MHSANLARVTIAIWIVGAGLGLSAGAQDTPLGPPGSELARMRTMNEVEPRRPIASLPFAVTNAGAYFLATALSGQADSNGISVSCSDVSIDLGGFSLNGGADTLNGIEVTHTCTNLTIVNGFIRDWGGFGITATAASDVVFLDLKAAGNGAGGLYAGENAYIQRCSVYGNGFSAGTPGDPPKTDGIQCGAFGSVLDCKSRGNKGAGIHTYAHSRVSACTATASAEADGIHAEDYCMVRDCVAAANMMNGIKAGSMCRVAQNTCGQNGGTNGAGILIIGQNSLIEENNVCNNFYGIRIQSGTADGNLIVRNSASNNTNDYYVVAGDYYGPLLAPPPGEIQTTNPWTNFKTQ